MTSLRSLLWIGARLGVLAFVLWIGGVAEVAAQSEPCGAANTIDVTFAGIGTRWRFCWNMTTREGLIVNQARYTDRSGVERMVLYRGSIAQVHVPYHTGTPRFHDITTSTGGLGAGAITLTPAECSPGTLLTGSKVCREVHTHGYTWKFGTGASSYVKGQEVIVWSSSQLGQYNYITSWAFKADGTIEPVVGFTGRLQITNSGAGYAPFGARVNPESAPTPSYAISHVHNIYYRLDFDIGVSANNAVDGIYAYPNYTPSPDSACANNGECIGNATYRLTNESYDNLSPFLSWRILNKGINNPGGRNIGYELVPVNNQPWYFMTDTTEPWSVGDLYVTTYNGCELLATENYPPYIPASCAGLGQPDVLAMTSEGDNIDGADLVLWYVTRFQHLTREEDQPNMGIEYQGVSIQPRSWRDKSTFTP